MIRTPLLVALTTTLLVVLMACESETTSAEFLRCHPELTTQPAPATGVAGDMVVLTGRHLMSYQSGTFDPVIDLAVSFGSERAVVWAVDGPYDVEEGACETCDTGVSNQPEGCLDCEEECEFCLTDLQVQVPSGQGLVDVSLLNGMGQSNTVNFTYSEDGTQTPAPTTPTTTPPTPTTTPPTPTSTPPTPTP